MLIENKCKVFQAFSLSENITLKKKLLERQEKDMCHVKREVEEPSKAKSWQEGNNS
jgi:hypothetical protein